MVSTGEHNESVHFSKILVILTCALVSERDCACPGFIYFASPIAAYLYSPNYPNGYCHNIQCSYLVKGESRNSVNVIIKKEDFDLEPRYDTLTIYEGNRTVSSKKIIA